MDMVLSFIAENRSLPGLEELPDGLSTLLLTPRFKVSRHVIFLILEPGRAQPTFVAKIPRLPHFRQSLSHEAGVLQTVQRLRPDLFQAVPQLIAYQEHHGYPILLESAVNGQLIAPEVVRSDPERVIQITRDWLVDVQAQPTCPHDQHWYWQLVESPLRVLREGFPLTDEERDLVQRCEQYLQVLKDLSLPYVLEHGDLGHPNLIRTGPGSIGVIDWELASVQGLIASDFFFFLSYVAFSLNHANESGEYICVFEKAFFSKPAWARPHVQLFLAALELPSNIAPALFLLSWLRYLVHFVKRLQGDEVTSIGPETAEVVRQNRYYAIWKCTVERFEYLTLV